MPTLDQFIVWLVIGLIGGALAGSLSASDLAAVCPYCQSSVPATTSKWLVSWTIVPPLESVPVSGASQKTLHR